MNDLQRSHLIPMQRATFECSARCCHGSDLPAIQSCTDRCQRPIMAAQQALYGEMQESARGAAQLTCIRGRRSGTWHLLEKRA